MAELVVHQKLPTSGQNETEQDWQLEQPLLLGEQAMEMLGQQLHVILEPGQLY